MNVLGFMTTAIPWKRSALARIAALLAVPGLVGGWVIGETRAASSPPRAPNDLAAALARAGYVAVPLRPTPTVDGARQMAVDATAGSAAVRLLLDSGYNNEVLIDPVFADSLDKLAESPSGAGGRTWLLTNGLAAGGVRLDAATVWAFRLGGLQTVPGVGGLLGAQALARRRAVVDYVADTLYLLPSLPSLPPRPAQPRGTPRTVRAALEAAGQYRTFLSLARHAGLMPLLDGTDHSATDSLIWTQLRSPAMALGVDTAGDSDWGRARLAVGKRFRQPGRITAFVPTDAAFRRLPPETLAAVRRDAARSAAIVRAHLLTGTALDTAVLRTWVAGVGQWNGPTYGVYPRGAALEVDRVSSVAAGQVIARARVVDPDLTSPTGVAHGIDRVLMPLPEPSPVAELMRKEGYVAIPMYRLPRGWYAVRASVDSVSRLLIVDTGAGGSGEDLFLPDDAPISIPRHVDLMLGTIRIPQAVAVGWQGPDTFGVLGNHLLADYRARIDFVTGTLYLRAP